jgi:hypothetical protein
MVCHLNALEIAEIAAPFQRCRGICPLPFSVSESSTSPKISVLGYKLIGDFGHHQTFGLSEIKLMAEVFKKEGMA